VSITWWSLVRFVHVLAASVWVGGQLVLSGVVLPVLRADLDPATRGPVVRKAARRFGIVANVALLPLLLATGLALLYRRGVGFGTLDDPGYGQLLGIKLVLVVVAVALAAGHGMVARRRPTAARPLAIGGLVASVLVVVYATALVP
jgi:putative copper export protein